MTKLSDEFQDIKRVWFSRQESLSKIFNEQTVTDLAISTIFMVYIGHANEDGRDLLLCNAASILVEHGFPIQKEKRKFYTDFNIDKLYVSMERQFLSKAIMQNWKTNGLFDPSIGLLLEYYGFGPNKIQNNINEDSIFNIMMSVGFDKISINNRKLNKENIRTKLDFNAIAKGYAVDVISNYIESKGVSNYLIDIGGEIKSSGINILKKSKWKIAINNPDLKSESNYYKLLELENISIATSGNYRNYKIDPKSGKKYVHTINPINGKSQETNVLSASVISESCFTADAFATAMMVGDIDNAIKLTEGNDEIDSFIIYVDSLNNVTEYSSFGFKKLFINP